MALLLRTGRRGNGEIDAGEDDPRLLSVHPACNNPDAISQVILGLDEKCSHNDGIRTRRGRHEKVGGENIASNGGTPDQIYRARAGLPLRTVQLQCSVQARISRGPKCQTERTEGGRTKLHREQTLQ